MTPIATQYRTIEAGAGWSDRASRGRLRFEGRDALPFLQALVSNDLDGLSAGRGVYTTYLTPQGRMIADLRLYHRGDFLIGGVAPGLAPALSTRFDQLIFTEDVRVTDDSAMWAEVAVMGGKAAKLVAAAVSTSAAALAKLPPLGQISLGSSGFVARDDDPETPGYAIFWPAREWDGLIDRLKSAGIVQISDELADALRIASGRPAFGVDMTEETIPLEAGLLDRAISTTKGCYVGQEVIIRVLHRGGGRVAKRLVRLTFDPGATLPDAGDQIRVDGKDVGRLTSVAWSPYDPEAIALGYVHRDAAEVGRRVTVRHEASELSAAIDSFAS